MPLRDDNARSRRTLIYTAVFLLFFVVLGAFKSYMVGEAEHLVLPIIVDGQTRYAHVDSARILSWACQVLPAFCDGRIDISTFSHWPPFSRDPIASPALRLIRDGEEEVRAWIGLDALAAYVDTVNPEIWFIGSSRVERGINIPLLEELLHGDGRDWSAVNLAVPGGGIETSLGVVRHYAARGATPHYIVYPIAAFELNESFPSPVLARYFMSVDDFISHLGETFITQGLDLNSRYYLSNIRYSLLERWDLPTIKDAREAMLYLPKKNWRLALERMRLASPRGMVWQELVAGLERPAEKLDLEALRGSLALRDDPTLAEYRVGKEKKRNFARLLEFCRNRGIKLLFVSTPITQWQYSALRGVPEERFSAFMQKEREREGFLWKNLSATELGVGDEDFVGIRRGREFLDPDHLNWSGAQAFTTSLYHSVIGPQMEVGRRAE